MIQIATSTAGMARRRLAPPLLDASLLAASPLFRDLTPAALAEIARAARVRRVAKGASVFDEDAPATRLYLVLEGRIKAVQATADGQQLTARFMGPGQPLGCVVLMGAETYPVTALAAADSVVAGWEAATVLDLAQRHPGIALNALRFVGGHLRETQARLREAVTERVERRIAHALLRLLRQSGRRTAAGVEIGFPVSRQDVAEMSGSTLFTVSRTLSAWELQGIVKSARRRITITAPHRLLQLAEGLDEAASAGAPPHRSTSHTVGSDR